MPSLPTALYERFGLNAYVQGDADKALSWFRKLEAKEPDSIRVLRNIGVMLLAVGDLAGAEAYILKEERLYGETFDRHAALADIAYAKGVRKEAARRYQAALADPEARDGGRGARSRRLFEARLEICGSEQAFQARGEGAARFSEAEALRDSGDFKGAFALFSKAFELDPTHWPAINNAGSIALNDIGDGAAALELFERAMALAGTPQVARNIELAKAALAGKGKPKRRPGDGAAARAGKRER